MLRTSIDDPYDQMRRNRLVEPRSRARSISPHRSSLQRDSRSQSVIARAAKERKGAGEGTASSRSEWFDKEPGTVASYDDAAAATGNARKSRPGFTAGGSADDWLRDEVTTGTESHSRTHSNATASGRLARVAKKPTRDAKKQWLDGQQASEAASQRRVGGQDEWKDGATTTTTTTSGADSRRSILECDVNPYLLLKKQKDEDDLSDDLSDNALEQDDLRAPSSLFDPSKVKSIERIPNRSAVAAIGGQRIRVFNEPREISDDDDVVVDVPPVTRIPIPKVSPKRPPRRLKEARQTLKSILKRGCVIESKRKNVLFNVDNVIFAPEKPSEATRLSWSRLGRIAGRNSVKEQRNNHEQQAQKKEEEEEEGEGEAPIVPQEQQEKHNFITIPNIRDPKVDRIRLKEPRIVPEVKLAPPDRIKIDKFVPSRKPDRSASKKQEDGRTEQRARQITESRFAENSTSSPKIGVGRERERISPAEEKRRSLEERIIRPEDETELEIEIEELNDRLPCIAVDEKDLISKSEGRNPLLKNFSREI